MRRVIFWMMASVDGYAETRDRRLDWHVVDEELHRHFNAETSTAGALLYGRRTFEIMAGHWPTVDTGPKSPQHEVEYARLWRRIPKVVFSRTLVGADWGTRVVRDNLVEEVTRLKEQPGGDLVLSGADVASTFIRHGLIDEYRLYVNPVVLGAGRPVFVDLGSPLALRLVETRAFGSSVVMLRYE